MIRHSTNLSDARIGPPRIQVSCLSSALSLSLPWASLHSTYIANGWLAGLHAPRSKGRDTRMAYAIVGAHHVFGVELDTVCGGRDVGASVQPLIVIIELTVAMGSHLTKADNR